MNLRQTLLIIAGLPIASVALAQQASETLPGSRTPGTYDSSGVDNIDLYSGDVGLTVALSPQYPLGPKYSWGLTAFGTDKIWNFVIDPNSGCNLAMVHGKPTLGAGWTMDLGHIEGAGIGTGTYVSPDGGRPSPNARLRTTCVSSSSCTVESPDGITQHFTKSYSIPRPSTGTSWDFNSVPPTNPVPMEVGLTSITNPFGKILLQVTYGDALNPFEVTQIDLEPGTAQARSITLAWTPLNVLGVTWPVLTQIQLPTAAGASHPLTVIFSYDTAVFQRNSYDICNTQTVAYVPTLLSMSFQDATSVLQTYSFTYVHNTGGNTDGLANHVVLPAGGTIDYTYSPNVLTRHAGVGNPPTDLESSAVNPPNFTGPSQAPPPPLRTCVAQWGVNLDHSAAVIKRVAKASTTDTGITTQYARDEYETFDPCDQKDYLNVTRRILVSDPNGNGTARYSKYLFHVPDTDSEDPTIAGIELERRYYADTNFGGTPVRTIANCYEGDAGGTACGYLANATTVQNYGMTGHVRRSKAVTWYGANPTGGGTCSGTNPACTQSASSLYNTTAMRYAQNVVTSTLTSMTGWTSRTYAKTLTPFVDATHWFLDLFSNSTVADAGAPAPRSVVTTTSFSTSTGFLNNQGIADAYGAVTNYFTPTNGDPTTIETRGTAPITGDFFDTCTYQSGLPVTCTRTGMSWKSLDVIRENNTGAVTTSRDPNALATTITYDALGRATKTLPPPGDDVTIRATRTCYLLATDNSAANPSNLNFVISKAGSSDASACSSNDSTALTEEARQLDGLGRTIREYRLMPNNLGSGSQFAIRDTTYDLAGHVSAISEWTPCNPSPNTGLINIGYCAVGLSTNNPTNKTTYAGFDTFGRPSTITKADGTATTISHADGSITTSDSLETVSITVSGATATTVTRTDALGRVISVQEPAVLGVADTSTYVYSALDKLATVTQGVQTRSFVLDARDWRHSETNPEGGTTAYSSYNALGDLLSKTDGASPSQVISTFTYDNAGRLLTLTTNEVNTPRYAQNTYDTNTLVSPPVPNYPKGQLTQSIGANIVLDPGPSVQQDVGYGGPGGRLSQRVTTIGTNTDVNDGASVRDGESIQTTENWTFNSLGLIDTYNHPRAVGTYQEDPSYATGLPASAVVGAQSVYSTLTYSPYGGFASWKSGNNVTTTIGQAANLLPRPSSITTTGAAPNFSSGTYTYDGAGNITGIGSDVFKYDARSRLVSALYSGQPTTCTDSLGNTLRNQCFSYDRYGNLTTRAGTNPQTLTTSTSTNQLTGQTYDTRGNMTSQAGFGGFDGLNRITNSFGWDYLYDASGERVAKFPDNPILRREMAKVIVQARGEQPLSTGCTGAVDSFFTADVACSDPDRLWIDQIHADGIASGYGGGVYGPANSTTRGEMSAFLARGKLAPNPVPNSGTVNGVPYNCVSGGSSHFADVAPTDTFCATINYIASIGITAGCDSVPDFCPNDTVPESQMMAFMRRGWSGFFYVPRGTIYTLRDPAGRVTTEMMSTPGSTSYPTNDFPIATTPTRDNIFLGNLLVGSYASSALGGAVGWSYYHSDHLGTPRLITGVESGSPKYWPYGDEVTGTPFTSERIKFGSMERDAEVSRFFDHARSHDFNLGRFVTLDRSHGNFSWNRYSYADSNPSTYIDPNGLESTMYQIGPGGFGHPSEWFGHAMLSVVAGSNAGYLSQTLTPPPYKPGSPTSELSHYWAEGRTVTAYHLRTTADEDRRAFHRMSTHIYPQYDMFLNNCSESVCRTLSYAGVLSWLGGFGGGLPSQLGNELIDSGRVLSIVVSYSYFMPELNRMVEYVGLQDFTKVHAEISLGDPFLQPDHVTSRQDFFANPNILIDGVSYLVY